MSDFYAYLILLYFFFLTWSVFIWLRLEVFRLSNAETLVAIKEQLVKSKDEILGRIAALEAAAAAGEDLSAPLADLAAVAQALDDVVPDAPAPDAPPVEG